METDGPRIAAQSGGDAFFKIGDRCSQLRVGSILDLSLGAAHRLADAPRAAGTRIAEFLELGLKISDRHSSGPGVHEPRAPVDEASTKIESDLDLNAVHFEACTGCDLRSLRTFEVRILEAVDLRRVR